jgi:hypothetical protein
LETLNKLRKLIVEPVFPPQREYPKPSAHRSDDRYGGVGVSGTVQLVYASRAALPAAATPTRSATMMSNDAIVVAEDVRSADTADIKLIPARITIDTGKIVKVLPIAIAITFSGREC